MSNKVFKVKVELTTFISSKPVKRKSDYWPVAADSPELITVNKCNEPENLHRFIPKFILGKSREGYRVTKVLDVQGPLGNN